MFILHIVRADDRVNNDPDADSVPRNRLDVRNDSTLTPDRGIKLRLDRITRNEDFTVQFDDGFFNHVAMCDVIKLHAEAGRIELPTGLAAAVFKTVSSSMPDYLHTAIMVPHAHPWSQPQ